MVTKSSYESMEDKIVKVIECKKSSCLWNIRMQEICSRDKISLDQFGKCDDVKTEKDEPEDE